jgi:hypothetical protein
MWMLETFGYIVGSWIIGFLILAACGYYDKP